MGEKQGHAQQGQTQADGSPPRLVDKTNEYIRIEHVTKRFGDFVAVDNVTLSVFKGEIFCLLGGSGCGKTTLLRMLAAMPFISSVMRPALPRYWALAFSRSAGVVACAKAARALSTSASNSFMCVLESLPMKKGVEASEGIPSSLNPFERPEITARAVSLS